MCATAVVLKNIIFQIPVNDFKNISCLMLTQLYVYKFEKYFVFSYNIV
jgi:hypothetical protein